MKVNYQDLAFQDHRIIIATEPSKTLLLLVSNSKVRYEVYKLDRKQLFRGDDENKYHTTSLKSAVDLYNEI